MGKQGPCHHCGVTSTPLWRNGPPEKPVLCNARGSRWRTKGSLVNYTPLHARSEPHEFLKVKSNNKFLKRKYNYLTNDPTGFDEDTDNRSSSGSAISNPNSDTFMQLDASDLTGPSQSSVVWETMAPSRKRRCFNRPKQSSVEKLAKDLYTILHEQQSCFSGSSEEDLIFGSDTPMVSVEIGHGSVLIRHPNSTQESEATSLSVDTKNENYSWFNNFPVNNVTNQSGNVSTSMDQDQYRVKEHNQGSKDIIKETIDNDNNGFSPKKPI